jgi:Domain of unknown function (DUF4266)
MVRLRLAQQLALLLLSGAFAACANVPRYQRGAIARPDMTTADLAGPAERHAVSVHEGAQPSGAVAESGCGCN